MTCQSKSRGNQSVRIVKKEPLEALLDAGYTDRENMAVCIIV